MLSVRNLRKSYPSPSGERDLFRGLSFDLPRSGRLAIFGRNGQGKSTLIKILGGVLWSNAGSVRWSMTGSWPLGFSGGFQGGLTGVDNIRFVSRIYNKPFDVIAARTEDFAELGEALLMPVKYYSSGMRARLAFGLSLAIEFDCYLIDELVSVGDASFREKCQDELFGRRADRAFIIASHDTEFLRQTCNCAIVIDRGRAKVFDDINLAAEIYEAIGARSGREAHFPHFADVQPVQDEGAIA